MDVIEFDSYIQATEHLARIMREVEEKLDFEYVVIVPDVYTFYYEKLLYLQNKGSFSVIVRSFSRLFADYCDTNSLLSKTGALLLVKKIVYEMGESLVCFKNSYKKSGFAAKMYETISRLRDQCVLPEDMKATSARKNKIEDIKRIYSAYLQETTGKYVDGVGKNELLIKYFEGEKNKQKRKYFVLNFDVLNESTNRLIRVIDKHSEGVTILRARFAQLKANATSAKIFRARDEIDQLKEVARNVITDRRNGLSYDDIAIAGEGINYERVKRIFDDYSVPFYLDKRISLGSHPLSRFVVGSLSCYKNMNREDVLALAKNPYVNATKVEKDRFCSYVNRFLVNYKGFFEPFEKEFDGVEFAERVRAEIVKVVLSAKTETGKCTAFDVESAVASVLKLAKDSSFVVDGVIAEKKAKEGISLVARHITAVFGAEYKSDEFFTECLRDVLAATEYSLIPQNRNQVKIGSLNNFRGQKYKKIYLLSFNEGVLPKVEEDCALLTDTDVREMESFGLEFEPKISNLNLRYRDELWQLLQNDGEFFFSYVVGEKGKKSYDLEIVKKQLEAEEYTSDDVVEKIKNSSNYAEFASYLTCEQNAVEKLYCMDSGEYSSTLYALFKSRIETYGKKPFDVVDGRYSALSKTSVSALQAYAVCPFKYFASYVLRLKKAEDGVVQPVDVGNIMHEVVEKYLDVAVKDPDVDIIYGIFDRVCAQNPKAALEENESIIKRLKEEALRLCRIARRQVEDGKYRLKGSEVVFGKEADGEQDSIEKTIEFEGTRGSVPLVGAIDRIDVYDGYARVIDYKTGGTNKLDFSELYYGEKLQLPLYGKVLEANGYKTGGLFYFPFVVKWGEDENVNKLSGIYENGCENTEALTQVSVDAGGEASFLAPDSKTGVNEQEMRNIENYAVRTAQRIVNLIEGGNFDPSPYDDHMKCACRYCEYKGLCRFDENTSDKRSRSVSDGRARTYIKSTEAE